MKKLILLCVVAACSTGIFAVPMDSNSFVGSAKIRKIFHQNFPEISNPTITNVGKFYVVSFTGQENNSSCRIYYDAEGNVVQTIRNYKAEKLTPFIRSKIESKYKGKSIFMVTDVSDENEHFYDVIIQDSKSLWIVHAKDDGTMFVQKKYKRTAG